MGCGSSTAQKVSPSVGKITVDDMPKERNDTQVEKIAKIDDNNNKSKSEENVKSSSSVDGKLLGKRPSSHDGSIRSVKESPKTGLKGRKLIRDSRGSVRPGSASSMNSELERKFSADIRKRENVEKLFQASHEKPALPPIGINSFLLSV